MRLWGMSEKRSSSRADLQTGPSRNSNPPEIFSARGDRRNMRGKLAGVAVCCTQLDHRRTSRRAPRTQPRSPFGSRARAIANASSRGL